MRRWASWTTTATFTQLAIDRGHVQGRRGPPPTTSAATTVQVRDGRTITTDGPYAETKEAPGRLLPDRGPDLDEAIDAAARIPGARHGSSRSGRSSSCPRWTPRGEQTEAVAQRRLTRPPSSSACSARNRAGRRDPDPGLRRLRHRRGGRPGSVRGGPRALALGRRSRPTPAPGSRRRPATGRSTGCAGRGSLATKTDELGRDWRDRRGPRRGGPIRTGEEETWPSRMIGSG
jgi:hypothetical protein